MQEICTVVKKTKNATMVSLKKSAKCEGCKACGFGRSNEIVMPAISETNYKIGESVIVEMPEKQVPASYLALYLIPLAFLAIGLVIGKIAFNEQGMLLFGLGMLVVGFLPAWLLDKFARKNRKYMPTIVGVATDLIKEANQEQV